MVNSSLSLKEKSNHKWLHSHKVIEYFERQKFLIFYTKLILNDYRFVFRRPYTN